MGFMEFKASSPEPNLSDREGLKMHIGLLENELKKLENTIDLYDKISSDSGRITAIPETKEFYIQKKAVVEKELNEVREKLENLEK